MYKGYLEHIFPFLELWAHPPLIYDSIVGDPLQGYTYLIQSHISVKFLDMLLDALSVFSKLTIYLCG